MLYRKIKAPGVQIGAEPLPKEYLFPGQEKGEPYSARSTQVTFNRVGIAGGIHKQIVSSFAIAYIYVLVVIIKR